MGLSSRQKKQEVERLRSSNEQDVFRNFEVLSVVRAQGSHRKEAVPKLNMEKRAGA